MVSLTLELRLHDGKVVVRLLEDGDEVKCATTSPLSSADLKALRDLIEDEQDLTDQIPQHAKQLGALLFPEPVLTAWKQKRELHGQPMRTVLDLDPALESYPWELAAAGERLFLNAQLPFVRKVVGVAGSTIPHWPVDMLIVLGSSKEELDQIGGYHELRRIRDTLRSRNRVIHLHVLDLNIPNPLDPGQASRNRIVSELNTLHPHILHFIGHGSARGLELIQAGGEVSWNEQAIRTDLGTAGFTPWLVYLNACRSAGNKPGFPEQFNALARAFLDKGARAVVAMHANIAGPKAAACAETFYQSLTRNDSVDVALTRARVRLDQSIDGSEPGVKEAREAYLPVLMVSCAPDEALPCLKDSSDPPKEARVHGQCQIETVVQELVNQDSERRRVLGSLISDSPPAHLIAIEGPQDTGKSWLLGWCIDGWLRRSYTVRYVPMFAFKHWFAALEGVLTGNSDFGTFGAPLPKSLAAFQESLAELVSPKAKAPRKEKASLFDVLPRKKLESSIADVSEAFNDALKVSTNDQPLVLVLDQFSTESGALLDATTFSALMTNWISKQVIQGDGRVRVIMGLGKRDLERYPALPRERVDSVPLQDFPAARYRELIDELLRARFPSEYVTYEKSIERELRTIKPESMSAKELSKECEWVMRSVKRRLPEADPNE